MSKDLLAPDDDPSKVEVQAPSRSKVTLRNGSVVDVDILPPTRGRVVPLIDGERTYAEEYDAIQNATEYIYLSLWYIQLDTKLFDRTGKKPKTLVELFRAAAKRGVKIRVLVNYIENQALKIGARTIDIFSGHLAAEKIAAKFNALDKNVVALVYKHPFFRTFGGKQYRPGTSHEKTMLVDGRRAFCGGIEFEKSFTHSNPDHKPWEKSDSPRHDVHTMITGSVVAEFEQHFVTRWRAARSSIDIDLPDNHSNYSKSEDVQAVQVTLTRSFDGGLSFQTATRTIADSYVAAVKAAKRLIYIENQYFRDQELTDALAAQIKAVPKLEVIVLVPERPEEKKDELTLHAEFLQHKMITQLLAVDAKRVGFFALRVGAGKYNDIYVHAKVMIVDDLWFTVGSANVNARSFELDDEINIVVRDQTVAHDTRVALWTEHFQAVGNASLAAKFEIAAGASLLDIWNTAASAKTAGTKSATRIKAHVPQPGKAFVPPRALQLLFPGLSIDQFVIQDRPLPPTIRA